jgi:hypothetical protein
MGRSNLVAGAAVAQHSAPTIKTRSMTPFWISFGATVALGCTAGVFGALALNANHDLDQALSTFPTDQQSVDAARSKVRTMAALTDGFAAASIVAAGTAVYFLISPPEHTELAPANGLHARLTPTPTGLSMSGTF